MPVPIGAVEYIGGSTKTVNHGVQKVVGESEADSFLFAAEHTEVLLGVAFHVDLGELHVALSWLVRNLNTLHAVKTEGDSAALFAVPRQNIVVTIVDYQLEGADFVSSATPTINLLRAVFDGEFLIAELDFSVLHFIE